MLLVALALASASRNILIICPRDPENSPEYSEFLYLSVSAMNHWHSHLCSGPQRLEHWRAAVIPITSQLSLIKTRKIVPIIRNFSIFTGTIGVQAAPVVEMTPDMRQRLLQRMSHLTHSTSLGDKLAFKHATRIMFNLTSDGISPLMATYEVINHPLVTFVVLLCGCDCIVLVCSIHCGHMHGCQACEWT